MDPKWTLFSFFLNLFRRFFWNCIRWQASKNGLKWLFGMGMGRFWVQKCKNKKVSYKIFIRFFGNFMGLQASRRKWKWLFLQKSFFKKNFDYVKVTPLWTFLGTKLTYFIYLVSLFCFLGSCIVRTEGPSLLLTFCMGF